MRFIALERGPSGLRALVARPARALEPPRPASPDAAASPLLERLARPPFSKDALGSDVVIRLLEAPAALAEAMASAPDRSFRKLEAACRRRDDEGLTARGMRALVGGWPEAVARAFHEEPQRLCEAARALGVLRAPERVRAAARLTADACGAREFVEQARAAAMESLARGLPADVSDPAVAHALSLLVDGDGNRRALRRFLKAHLSGDRDYVARHPATRAWFARHPEVAPPRWMEGIVTERHVEGYGPVRIAVEQDPLEALKLGTYVGSCLGVGGLCAYSAAAVVLDVNKRVLYARLGSGRVVARQLVALSRSGELVGFSVYPESAIAPLKAMFHEHDASLAAALGVPMHRPAPGVDYEIEHILSHEWWDDGAEDVPSDGGEDAGTA